MVIVESSLESVIKQIKQHIFENTTVLPPDPGNTAVSQQNGKATA